MFIITLSLILSFSSIWKKCESSKQLVGLHSYTQQVVSNSQFLVFYMEQCHITLYDNETTWNSTGFDEIYQQPCKLSINIFTKNVMMSLKQYDQKRTYLFF